MPTFDGGHYFLTVLAPVRTDAIADGATFTSPVHALRKRLSTLPPAAQTAACSGAQSPFARNARNHFARFVVIDDVAYNGREPPPVLWSAARAIDPAVAQPQDHLKCPFLLFATDFDAASGADAERDSHLSALWETMQQELCEIFQYCVGFDAATVTDAASFARYIARCQIETTMPFNDYYIDPLSLPNWLANGLKTAAIVGAAGVALGIGVAIMWHVWAGVAIALFVLLADVWQAYSSLMTAGEKPLPAAPDATLPTILKALHLQREFTRFAIDNQSSPPQMLHQNFAAFIGANKPGDPQPAQQPGVIGI